MKMKIVDDQIIFATHLIRAVIQQEDYGAVKPFHKSPNGLLCYSETEKVKAETALTKLGIPFTTETITVPRTQKDKSAGIKYNSRTEAIKHLTGEIEEPEREVIPRLKREKAELQTRVNQAEAALLTVMCNKPNQSANTFLQRKYSEGNIGDADLQVAVTKGFITVADVSKISGIISKKLL